REGGYVGEGAAPGPQAGGGIHSEMARRCDALQRVLYGSAMTGLFEEIFGEPVRHFDFSWLRAISPGRGTKPHMDNVFMNRGTPRLLTAWVPLGDVPLEMGGVAVLEGSHRLARLQDGYADRDVDTYCVEDGPDGEWWNGTLREDADGLRAEVGSRWLTGSYRAGDVLVFTMLTAHCGLDNGSDEVRLSCDIRYQPASEPVDGRWVGPDPSAHGPRSKVGVIC
ncbi:MAG TPA: phytanoyl-CoA dioxygenase family protein, partial [Acidimicrobiales bacterium]|nr:phytanoyl-CoA dioxygenase family protein [Acidimicrobiales bacterium]